MDKINNLTATFSFCFTARSTLQNAVAAATYMLRIVLSRFRTTHITFITLRCSATLLTVVHISSIANQITIIPSLNEKDQNFSRTVPETKNSYLSFFDTFSDSRHKGVKKVQVVEREKTEPCNLFGFEKMSDVTARILSADKAIAFWIKRLAIFKKR